jgi:tetratricopeptide (TPR) repeat protein
MILTAATVLLLAVGAQAADASGGAPASSASVNQEVEALYAEGAALFRAGKYRLAIGKFEAAYALYPEPNLLYNAGRAYEALGELQVATDNYQAAVKHADASPELRAKATERLAFLRSVLRTSKTAVEPGAPTVTPAASTNTTVIEEESSSVGWWIVGGVGVVAVAGAGVAAALLLIEGDPYASSLDVVRVAGK